MRGRIEVIVKQSDKVVGRTTSNYGLGEPKGVEK